MKRKMFENILAKAPSPPPSCINIFARVYGSCGDYWAGGATGIGGGVRGTEDTNVGVSYLTA